MINISATMMHSGATKMHSDRFHARMKPHRRGNIDSHPWIVYDPYIDVERHNEWSFATVQYPWGEGRSERNLPLRENQDRPTGLDEPERNMIHELNDTSKARPLFAGWRELDTGVLSCLDRVMGTILVTDPDGPRSAMAVIGDFAFCTGEPDLELVRGKPDRWMLVVPQNEAWTSLIEEHMLAYKRIRYAIRKDTVFDREKLDAMEKALPEAYSIRRIDGELYDLCLADGEFKDCVSVFGSKEKYLSLGRGFAVLKDGKIVSAASSYSRYSKGIDIEIGTVREERHKGLASAVAARLIIECLDEGLYPAWDAANMLSVRLAEKLGYEFSHEYCCFAIE